MDIKQTSSENAEILVSDLINLHCGDTLTELNLALFEPYHDFFDSLNNPFKKVENLTLNGYVKTLDSPSLTFDQLFPVMKNLSFDIKANVLMISNIDHEFANLKHLSLSVLLSYDFGPRMHDCLKTLIGKNPQIQSLTLVYSKRDLMKFIAENLPKLEHLKLLWKYDYDEPNAYDIHFDHVKTLSVQYLEKVFGERETNAPRNLHFNNIEELETESFNGRSETWLDLVERSTKSKKLSIEKGALYDSTFVHLISIAPNLVEFSARVRNRLRDYKMVDFIRSHAQLEKVHWSRTIGFQESVEPLRREIGDQWTIETVGSQYIFLAKTLIFVLNKNVEINATEDIESRCN
ncbi:uncharacterized protein LOC129570676 isoform X1 [Sitodiplosis mosellana]|uniref:uncharacterized protein LOC129570676 isoform X1 n=1 Tax=Sitodiplosis mosellana TaxID=263140 RepID=UPI002444863C|nr:uncharacterized protein LOC129570676 isoform X1 [Sitodiplosis mosellana]